MVSVSTLALRFSPLLLWLGTGGRVADALSLSGNHQNSNNPTTTNNVPQDSPVLSRRDWLATTAAVSTVLSAPQQANSAQQPIAVLGASGRTGALCVTACLSRGFPVKALTRTGEWISPMDDGAPAENDLLTVEACDIKDPTALANSLKGCRGVIYAASASKKGGNAAAIDNVGVVQAGNICLAEKVPRYIVISSTSTTRPKSMGYIFTNVMGGIMDQKRLGEEGVINAYQTAADATSFTIVRPGGLEEPKKNEVLGPRALEITQGDVLAGIVSRADLAEVAVELAASTAPNLRNTALELYYTDSTVPVDGKFKAMMNNGVVPRLHGQTYAELLQGIEPYVDYYLADNLGAGARVIGR
ncbi:Complex I intermediate-associated protein 30 domain containing protein [Seminavis robusta]|uniref:Complex I intermediate-associated protein 30 domain containing protein n=1 Tax=Seminavis robusta TaxID=568900 RepID=A0A9N8HT65_9STRA|nr:Complex I intermediate-associated protein 30 domain containing protein [Seminavis robusta]|eukprot:Sro1473_g275640.1 Complex I intermediate-associated protein 30 domain containing protein (358) ;mRNA; r:17228-18405